MCLIDTVWSCAKTLFWGSWKIGLWRWEFWVLNEIFIFDSAQFSYWDCCLGQWSLDCFRALINFRGLKKLFTILLLPRRNFHWSLCCCRTSVLTLNWRVTFAVARGIAEGIKFPRAWNNYKPKTPYQWVYCDIVPQLGEGKDISLVHKTHLKYMGLTQI